MLKKIVDFFTKNKLTLSTAESVTGGLISDCITNIPGSSQYFLGGIVAYSNPLKEKLLKVKKSTIIKHGAVSEEAAAEMAEGARKTTGSDISVAVTGIAGPGGATFKKPVGLVYIAVAGLEKIKVKKFIFKGARISIKRQTVKKAFDMLEGFLKT